MQEIITYTVKELESVLHVKSKAIRGYIKSGKLKATRIGKGYIIKAEDVKQFIEQN